MAAPQGQAQLTLDGNDIAGAIAEVDANGNATIPYNSTSTPPGTHNISSRFIPTPGNSQPSSDANGRGIQVDAPLTATTTVTGAISPDEFPQGTVVPVSVAVAFA